MVSPKYCCLLVIDFCMLIIFSSTCTVKLDMPLMCTSCRIPSNCWNHGSLRILYLMPQNVNTDVHVYYYDCFQEPPPPPLLWPYPIRIESLQQVSSFKCLSVWLTNNLNWSEHIHYSIAKKAPGWLVLHVSTGEYTPYKALLKYCYYVSFMRPHMEYAAPVWNLHCTSQITVLERVQKFQGSQYNARSSVAS